MKVFAWVSLFERRLLLFFGIGAIYLLPFACSSWFGSEWYKRVWSWFGVPVMLPIFADLRGVTAPLECFASVGLVVYEQNSCDPWNRPFNYPRVWLLLYYLGIQQSHTPVLGFILLTTFICSLLYLFKLVKGRYLIVALPLLLSPPVALIMERANNDIFIFLILVGATFISSRSLIGSSVLLLSASFLKIYPVFSFVALLQGLRARGAIVFSCVLLFFIGYSLLFFEDFARIDQATASPKKLAYGFALLAESATFFSFPFSVTTLCILCGTIFAMLVLLGLKTARFEAASVEPPTSSIFAFQAGAAIFIGTYLIDNHYYYRLVFLLLCFPYVILLIESQAQHLKFLARVLVVLFILQFWGEYFTWSRGHRLDEWANLVSACLLSYLLGISMVFSTRITGKKIAILLPLAL